MSQTAGKEIVVGIYLCLGVSAMVAAGPFTTSDSLDMVPLSDLLRSVAEERPDILILVSESIVEGYVVSENL